MNAKNKNLETKYNYPVTYDHRCQQNILVSEFVRCPKHLQMLLIAMFNYFILMVNLLHWNFVTHLI